MNEYEIMVISRSKLKDFHKEVAQDRMAREAQTNQPSSRKLITPLLVVGLVAQVLGLGAR